MRLFVSLCALLAIAHAKPQYNYGAGVSGSLGGGNGFSGIGSGGFVSGGGLSGSGLSGLGGLGGVGGVLSNQGGNGFLSAPSAGFGGLSSLGGGSPGSNFQQSGGYAAPIVHKQFYTISAPEDTENLEQRKHFVIGRPQKNYRVVFIKAPSSSNANVRLSAEYAPQEEKTAIYVLSKKDSALEVNDIATPAPTVPSKPEVFFIKYKTDEEAHHAQRKIQAEYDRIQGTSEHSDGGIAPVQSVIGSLDGGSGLGGSGLGGSGLGGSGHGGSGLGDSGLVSSGLGDSGLGGIGIGPGGLSGGAQAPSYLPPGKK